MTFDFEERPGQLFDCVRPTDGLVCCISEDGRFGKGTSCQFRQRFPAPQPKAQNRRKTYNRVNYNDLEACLVDLRKTCERLGVWSLALPHDFTGVDGIQDKVIKDLLFKTFHGWPGKMVMYHAPQ